MWTLDLVEVDFQNRERKTLTVMTDSVVLLSRDLALLRGGRVAVKSRPWPASRLCS